RKALGMTTSQEEIKEIRAAWADLANKALEQAGYQDRIDHRSYVDQGKDLQPTIHEGSKVTQLRRQGIVTEISRFNDEIKRQNEKRLNPSIQPREQALASGLNRVEDRFEQWKKDQEAKKLAQDRQLKLQQDQEKQARLAKQQENKTKSRGLEK
ncbi:MobA/MobL family protein, partial [uncultured Acinetobacter sp.]|uniref:MobA/MobL family protein n=1 Tax=uncultured Acinetobacter sp. TaxID=165433 RepID=UPI002632B584